MRLNPYHLIKTVIYVELPVDSIELIIPNNFFLQ